MIATDAELRVKGVNALINNLGDVETEKFISLIIREKFNYTKWQSTLFANKSIDDISLKAMEYKNNN